MNKSPQLEN